MLTLIILFVHSALKLTFAKVITLCWCWSMPAKVIEFFYS